MTTGVVKWFNAKKGFGFLVADDGTDQDVFVHYSEIQTEGFRTLREGDKVEFELDDDDKGPRAREVNLLEEASL